MFGHYKEGTMKRRTFMKGLAAIPMVGAMPGMVRAQSKQIRMIESGGASGEGVQIAYCDPLMQKTGIKIIRENPSSLGKLRALVESGQNSVVLFELGSGNLLQAKKLGLIEKIDWDAVNPEPMFDESKHEYGFGFQYYSTLMAWRKGMKEPKNFVEFFDTKAFPGKRSLPDLPQFCLPFALQAAGVPKEKLFPLDVDLALSKLNEIKNDVAVWWSAGSQPIQLLKDNEVQYAICWSGRAVVEPSIAVSFEGGMASLSYFCIVKGASAEDKAAAWKFMHELSVPANQAKAATILPYTGSSPNVDPLLPQDKLWQFPTTKQNKATQFVDNSQWWADNGEAVNKRWQAFKLGL
jgi:putative spermidine/putrescine transport system substrate-binding protein